MIKRSHQFVLTLPREAKQALLVCMDALLLYVAVWAAFAISQFERNSIGGEELLMAVAPLLAIPVFIRFGLYRAVIRYLSEHVLWTILKAMTVSALLWGSAAWIAKGVFAEIHISTVMLFWTFGVMSVAGVRFAARWLIWLPVQRHFRGRQALIYGAGEAGRQIAATLREARDSFPAGFLDDDTALQGKDVNGLRVYPPKRLAYLIEHYAIHEVIVALPSVSSARKREIVEFLEGYPVHVRILPEVAEIVSGQNLLNRIREVDIGDLLGRDVVAPDLKLLGQSVTRRNVLVTGAGGSIGAELCRQISALNPNCLVLLEQSEFALYQVERNLRNVAACKVVARLGSVSDYETVAALLREHTIHTVFHAAAYKHVPIVEENIIEGCQNNVFGTLTMAQAAYDLGVETFVLISTDKAVRPTNVMGATKRWAELVVQSLAREAQRTGRNQKFCAVRFGNVLGSSGSVIPLFREQIAQGGPVTVTHPEVTRFFMSIHEAVQLVIQASNLASGGEIFLLDMGSPVKIADLAANMIRLSGRAVRNPQNPRGDIDVVFIGLRPGEKLFEELLIASGNAEGTSHPKIMKAAEPMCEWPALQEELKQLSELLARRDAEAVRSLLIRRAVTLPSEEGPIRGNASAEIVQLHLARSAAR